MFEYCNPFAKTPVVKPKGRIEIDQVYVVAGRKGHLPPANTPETAQRLQPL